MAISGYADFARPLEVVAGKGVEQTYYPNVVSRQLHPF
jgi:hypothetical protein